MLYRFREMQMLCKHNTFIEHPAHHALIGDRIFIVHIGRGRYPFDGGDRYDVFSRNWVCRGESGGLK